MKNASLDKFVLLKKHFGYDTFRVGQEAIISHVLARKDVLGIMPTGGGKSLCYQLPALMLEGVTLVISPLIALMKDQVDSLGEDGIESTFLNSTLSLEETRLREKHIIEGRYKIIYVAPERLVTDSFYYLVKRITINFVAVDEAHCISQWGHDFRPSYKNIPAFIGQLPIRPTIGAFTATATPFVIEEIKTLLQLEQPFELVTGFDRENLVYRVIKPLDKYRYVKDYITTFLQVRMAQVPDAEEDIFSTSDEEIGAGIIYCSTRKTVEALAKKLKSDGFSVAAYHGGMENDMRSKIQDRFMKDKTRIIVATNAFGMGIDKPDVRFVLHYNMPKNMESYYQEAGRAGRDGEKSECILMYSPSDIVKQKMLISQTDAAPNRLQIQRENLQHLINYCHSDKCLRGEIVHYFGEVFKAEGCGSCGNCLDETEFVDMTVEAQKIMSCIYRTNERFGLSLIIQVLRGSKNKRIIDFNLNETSTYGLLKDLSEGALREIMMNLIARGYIQMTTDTFPVSKLTANAKPVLKGTEAVLIKQDRALITDEKSSNGLSEKKRSSKKGTPKKGTSKRAANGKGRSASMLSYDEKLYELLAQKRSELALSKNVPRFVIFSNVSLEEMAAQMPVSDPQFLDIKGVGEAKLEHYGEQFMQVIRGYKKSSDK